MDGGLSWTNGDSQVIFTSYYDATNLIGAQLPTVVNSGVRASRLTQTLEVRTPSELSDETADVWVRVAFLAAGTNQYLSVDSFYVEVPIHDYQSMVRDARGSDCTQWIYYWPALDSDPTTALGIDTLATTGTDLVEAAHISALPRPMETAYRRGAYSATDWATSIVSVITATNGATYSFDIDGTYSASVNYVDGSPTATEVRDLLITQVNAVTASTGITATALGTFSILLTSTTGTAITAGSPLPIGSLTVTNAFVNCDVSNVSPLEMAFIAPTRTSNVRDELLQLTTNAPHEASLSIFSTAVGSPVGSYPQDPTNDDVLLEIPSRSGANAQYGDGIAYTNVNGNWDWRGPQTIRLNASIYSVTSAFAFSYKALIRATSSVIDLTNDDAITDWEDFLWLFDAPYWHGAEPNIKPIRTLGAYGNWPATVGDLTITQTSVGLTFDGNGIALLDNPALTTSGARVTVNDGRRIRTLSQNDWRWVTSTVTSSATNNNIGGTGVAFAIRFINPAAIDTNAVYTLTYNPAEIDLVNTAGLSFSTRAGATVDDVLSADWIRIDPNAPLDLLRDSSGTPANAYHQFRAEWSDVQDVDRTKLWALGAKGIRLRTAPLTSTELPGIISD